MTVGTLPNYRIAYVRQVGPYGPANIQAMDTLKRWAKENDLLTGSATLLGIPQDDPATTPPEYCRYDACIVIPEDYEPDHSIHEGEFVGGTYVICEVEHTAEHIQQAWDAMIPFVQNSGYIIDNKPVLERYRYEMLNNELCEMCVPVRAV